MFTEMVECGHKREERVKAMKSEIKENAEITRMERKLGLTSMVWP